MARVATKGTAQASPSADKLDGGKATTGAWTPGPVDETADTTLNVGGAGVLHQAQCTFTFAGSMSPPTPPTPVSDSSTVVLSPKSTTLRAGQTAVLLDGDSAKDLFGNTVQVSVPPSSKLASS
jgi:hypothetical protein